MLIHSRHLVTAILLVCLLGSWLLPRVVHAGNNHPNVVFIFADDMGYGEIESLNPGRCKVPTPSLNQLASEGMTFTDAHTSSSVCSPSRYSLLTGRYNWRTVMQHGVLQGGDDPLIAADRMTLGNLFQNQGYSTAIIGKWHLNYNYQVPGDSKFDAAQARNRGKKRLANVPIGTKVPDGPLTRGFDTFYGFHHARSMCSVVRGDEIVEETSAVEVLPDLTREAVKYIDKHTNAAKSGKPFLLYLPLSSPHSPIVPADPWKGKTDLGSYGDFVAQTDATVGAVMEALQENGLSENTILFFSADNGSSKVADFSRLEAKGHYASANLRGSKADLWDGGHRVPFMVRWPGKIEMGSECDQLICLSDMMATFAEYFSFDFEDDTAEDSISFLPALFGRSLDKPREAIVHHSISGHFAIRQNEWKLLLAPGSGGWSFPQGATAIENGLPEMQLYNMNEDIGEQHNLVEAKPDKVTTLLTLLTSYVDNGRSTPGATQANDAEVDIWKKSLWQNTPIVRKPRSKNK